MVIGSPPITKRYEINIQMIISLQRGSTDLNDEDFIISPHFYSSQGNYKSYFDKIEKNEKLRQQKRALNEQSRTKTKLKRKRECSLKSSSSASYIVRRDRSGARGRYLIKINIHELTECEDDCGDSDDASVSVQYIVREPFDEIMDATQGLVRKICNKLE